MNIKTVYCSDDSESQSEMVAYLNSKNQIFIRIYDSQDPENVYYSGAIVLDKRTAIRLAKDLRREISFMEG